MGKAKVTRVKLPTKGQQAADAIIAWCQRQGLPIPVREHYFAKPRKWQFDLAWSYLPECRELHPDRVLLAVEINGGGWVNGRHNRASSLEAEYEKLSHAAALGWRVIPVTYAQLNRGELWPLLEMALT